MRDEGTRERGTIGPMRSWTDGTASAEGKVASGTGAKRPIWSFRSLTLSLPLSVAFSVLATAAAQAAPAPVLFFSDLTSGPNTGGDNGSGTYVTIYGNFFGSNPTVTVGAGAAIVKLQPSAWMWYQKMTIQLGPNAATGNIVLTNSNGTSNGIPFTIRAGNIYFISTSGSDTNNGSFGSPWRTIPHAVQIAGATAGNIIFAMDGVSQTADDGQAWNAALTLRYEWCQGTQAAPDALMAYPGANVQIGPSTGLTPVTGLRSADFTASRGACGGYWTFGGLNFRGAEAASVTGPSQYWRFVGNDVSNAQNPGGGGGSACFEIGMGAHNNIYGNNFHDMNLATTDRLAQGLYLSTDANYSDVGWNTLYNSKGRAGLQTHSSPLSTGNGYILYSIQIHDNIIHGTAEEAILVDTVDPSKGPILVYNNVIYDAGRDGSGSANHHMQLSGDFDQSHGVGSGWIEWYNNTVYCQGTGSNCWGSGYVDIHDGRGAFNSVHNELLYSASSEPYWAVGVTPWNPGFYCTPTDTQAQCPTFRGSNNLVYGNGAPTFANILTANLNVDPKLVSPTGSDFHLQNGSPAIGAGVAMPGLTYDIDGRIRPNPPSIGAYEYGTGAPPPPPTCSPCDVNCDGVTNVVDVQLEVNMALGVAPCTGDINKDGICNVIDVQRVVNAALGGACVSP